MTRPIATFDETNEVFHDRALFEREMEVLFRRGWTFAGTWDRLPGPDTWFVTESWGRSVLVTRDADGALGAFVNACTHRGTRLCPGDAAGSGRLQCPYHGWVFGCDGRLIGASRRAGLPDFDDADLGLVPLAVERVGAFIFVHGDPATAPPVRAWLGEKAATLEEMTETASSPLFTMRMPIKGNWKLVVSGAIEDYHVPFVHGGSLDPKRESAAVPSLAVNGHSSFITPAPAPWVLRAAIRVISKKPPHPHLDNHLIFPSFLLVRILGVLHVTSFVPVAPDLTIRVSRLYDQSPRRRLWNPVEMLRRTLAFLSRPGVRKVFREDRDIVEEAQVGTLAGRRMRRGPAHAEEARVEHFLGEVRTRLEAAEAGRDATTTPADDAGQ